MHTLDSLAAMGVTSSAASLARSALERTEAGTTAEKWKTESEIMGKEKGKKNNGVPEKHMYVKSLAETHL